MNNNQIESYGLILLLNCLQFLSIVNRIIIITEQPIDDSGACHIYKHLVNCMDLPHRIDLSGTNITNKGMKIIISGMVKDAQMTMMRTRTRTRQICY